MTDLLLPAPTPATAHAVAPTTTRPSLGDLAAAAKPDRNRAVDVYRAVAMIAVAIGHWLAMVAFTDDAGDLVAGNALSYVASLSWLTWLVQVMPLFFVVGGFASAASLDAHARAGGTRQDWIAARLRRMLPPAAVLAAAWLVAIAVAVPLGGAGLVIAGAAAAAIPLWFLANYTIDTAVAPFLLPRFRRNPVGVAAVILGVFAAVEVARIAGVPYVTEINWVLGWLSFQMLGMAWHAGLLPTGRRLLGIAAGLWAATFALVLSGGPWSITMVNFPGVEHSPTHPPTLSLLTFGLAYGLTAIWAAPAVTRWFAGRPRAWAGVVAANSMAMSIYLWHMTAAIIVFAAMHLTFGLPEVVVGSADWWWLKIPTIAAATLVLAPIVAVVARVERAALLAPKHPWNGGVGSMLAVAALTSAALKFWTAGGQAGLILGSIGVVVLTAALQLSGRSKPAPLASA